MNHLPQRPKRRKFLTLLGTAAGIPLLHARSAAQSPTLHWECASMGSRFKLYADQEEISPQIKAELSTLLRQLESTFTVHRPDSAVLELCRRGNAQPGKVIPVSPDLLEVTEAALKISAETHDAFDLTTGSLTSYWRYCKASGKAPDPARLNILKARTGAQQLKCHQDGISFHPQADQILLDYGGIAKGYAADRLLAHLQRQGISRVCLDLGGEILAGEAPLGKKGWDVALTDHVGTGTEEKLTLSHSAASTSGDRYQSIHHAGSHYSHILTKHHPLGLPVNAQITIQAPTAMKADALATAERILSL